jgi:peptide/nickel transport system ATP-binding protein
MTLLTVENLGISLAHSGRPLLEGASFALEQGDRLGLIGESGSGKSITALAVLGLLPDSMRAMGSVRLEGTEIVGAAEETIRPLRGAVAAMVFQEPLSALDPLMKVERQLNGPLGLHRGLRGEAARTAAFELLDRVRLPDPRRIAASYPHELSGGQRQRVAIAMALACRPRLLIADEPTTALDVTVQAEVLSLLDELVTDEGMALLFITHDLPVISQVARRLLVLEAGKVVESGTTAELLAAPRHPSTARLLTAARRVTTLPWARDGRP